MSKHFQDAQYYLKRAGEHAALGVKETLEPVQAKVREITGTEAEPEPSRVDSLLEEIKALEEKAEGEAKAAIGDARERVEAYRGASD